MRDVQWSFISIAISSLVHFLLRIVLGRELGASGLGLYTLSFTVYSFGIIFSAFGIGAALVKYVAQSRDDAPRTSLLVSSGSISAFFIGCVFGLILYVCSPPIANTFFDMPELEGLLRIVAIAFPFIGLEKATLGFLNGLRRMRLFAFINITQNVLTIIFTVLLVSWGYGLNGAVFSFVLPVILLSLFSLFSIRKSLVRLTLTQYTSAIKLLLIFGSYVVLANGIGTIPAYLDSIMLGYFLTGTDVGVYAVAILLALAIQLPSRAIQTITNPTMATYWGRGEIDNIEDLINKVMKSIAIFIVPVVFLMEFLGHKIIAQIFGAEFSLATFPLQILLIGSVFAAILVSVGNALSSTAYVNILFKLEIITLAANIVLNLVLIPYFGLAGAATATTASTIIGFSLNFYFIQRLIGIRIYWGWFVKLFGFTTLLASATYGFGLLINHYVSISIAVIVLIFILLKYFITREDLALIRGIIPLGRD